MIPEFGLSLTDDYGRLYLAGIFFLLGFSVTCWSYFRRRAVPPVPQRTLLFLLRGLSVLFISFILLGPVLQVRRTRMVKPSWSVLIDRSLSMELPVPGDDGEPVPRIEKVREHIRGERLIETLQSETDAHFFVFTDHAIPIDPDSIFGSIPGLSTGRTDIVAAMRDSREMVPDPDGLIVVTDGRINRGEDLRGYLGDEDRVLFLGVGEDTGSPDIDIAGVEVSPRIYEGPPVPMTVTLRARTETPDTVTLTISEGGRQIETMVVALEPGEFHRDVNLSIGTLSAGRHVIQLSAEGMEPESFVENNRRHLVLEVLSSEKRALIISTAPCWDLSFLVKTMRGLDYLSVDLYLFGPGMDEGIFIPDGGGIPGRTSARDLGIVPYDLICLQGDIADPRLEELTGSMQSFSEPGKGIVMLATEGIERPRRGAGPFAALLPATVPESFEIVSGRFDIVPPLIDETGLTRLVPDLEQNLSNWSSLPPITALMSPPSGKGGGAPGPVTLLSARNSQGIGVPVVVVEDRQGARIVSMLGRGFWRWSFHRPLYGYMGSDYRRLVDSLIRWACRGLASGEIRLIPASPCFQRGDPIVFRVEGQGTDKEMLVTVESAEGNVPPDTISYRLHEARKEVEDLSVSPQPPGDYRYSYRFRGGKMAGQGNVYVDSYSKEFSRPQPDNQLLEEVMLTSVGQYTDLFDLTAKNLSDIALFSKVEKSYLSIIVINKQPLLFIVILILLIVEIFLRKSAGFS